MNSSTTGYGVELVQDLNVVVPMSGLMNVRLNLPTFLSRSSEYNTENIDLKMFLNKEKGSIAVSQAKCITHHINIALSAKNKRFTKTFLDAVLSLQLAADVLNNSMFYYMCRWLIETFSPNKRKIKFHLCRLKLDYIFSFILS